MDLDRAEQFYRVLGPHLIVRDNHYLRFECPRGEATFSVERGDRTAHDEGVTLYFETEDLDAEYRRLRAAGVGFDAEPADMTWLWREARLQARASAGEQLSFLGAIRHSRCRMCGFTAGLAPRFPFGAEKPAGAEPGEAGEHPPRLPCPAGTPAPGTPNRREHVPVYAE